MDIASKACKGVLCAVLGGMGWLAGAGAAMADEWPTRSVRVIVPAAPGGSADPLARMISEELGRALKQSFVVENRPGANGNVGASMVAREAPDGYTLLLSWTGTLVSAVTMYNAKPFDPRHDFEPIALIGSIPNVVVVSNAIPAQSLDELTAYAKGNPGAMNFGSTGSGSSWHLSGELYKKQFDVSLVHVPYTSPATVLTDLASNRLQASFPGATAVAPFVTDGKIRALAVMAAERSPVLPSVPTTVELGLTGLESATWIGLLAPKGTPQAVIDKVNHTVNAALEDPAFRQRLLGMGYTPLGGSGAHFAAYMNEEIEKWGEIVKFSGASID
ncbi:tripartite tricarboxylate transporter substrate binding protein [Verticiella sediminum]|uniref:Tripartite tricarboxylate transporter substrate binding protein n=1 Tax=Verticiella sediminum TaxID=1247510 RepID=A0A556B0U8_9BURK|nr:tripartite tricarboxylate transporter substrate binding protein [Verticiella sediminum]TSH98817.1 tripartite tricarboxylate transporter substrate binding protein [Verticiella sediminum]